MPGAEEGRRPRVTAVHADDELCPSAQPEMEGSVAFGIVGGTASDPVVSYLAEPQAVTPSILALADPVEPSEVFRFAAPCAMSGCQHFDGARCQLAAKLVERLPIVVDRLPPCRIRPSCRWWREQGPDACKRCPMVVTRDYSASPALRVAADPATEPAPEPRPP